MIVSHHQALLGRGSDLFASEPGMSSNVTHLDSSLRICNQNPSYQVASLLSHKFRDMEHAFEYFLIKNRCIFVLERKIPTEQSK